MKYKYQKCIDRIVIEPNKWVYKDGNPQQLSIYLKWSKSLNTFRYVPRYSEIKSMISGLKCIYGKEQVEKELNISLGDDKNDNK